MRRIPRGLFLIINVDEVEGKPPRKGTNFDRDNLMNLLCRMHFEPVVYNDSDGLSAQVCDIIIFMFIWSFLGARMMWTMSRE